MMNGKDKMAMKLYGITCIAKMMYHYNQYTYEKLADALRYAEIDTKRTHHLTGDETKLLEISE